MSDSISGGNAVENQSQGWDDSIEIVETSHPIEKEIPEPKEPPAEEQEEEGEQEDAPKAKKPKGFVKKLHQKDEAIAALSQREQQLLAEIEQLKGGKPKEAEKPAGPVKPNPADFENPNAPDRGYGAYQEAKDAYNEAIALQKAQDLFNEALGKRDEAAKAQAQQQLANVQLQQAADRYTNELAVYEEENPGTVAKLDAVIDEVNPPEVLMQLILQSKESVRMADYLADNKEQLQAISKMQPLEMVLSLARLEGVLEGSKSSPSLKRQTQASAPIKPIGGSKARTNTPTDFNKMSQEDFERDFLELGKKVPRW